MLNCTHWIFSIYWFLLEEKHLPGEQIYNEKKKLIFRLTGSLLKGKSMQLSLISIAFNHLPSTLYLSSSCHQPKSFSSCLPSLSRHRKHMVHFQIHLCSSSSIVSLFQRNLIYTFLFLSFGNFFVEEESPVFSSAYSPVKILCSFLSNFPWVQKCILSLVSTAKKKNKQLLLRLASNPFPL